MSELREGMLTCVGCPLGTGVEIDAEMAKTINSHALDMLDGTGVLPGDKTDGRILQCAAAVAISLCRNTPEKQTIVTYTLPGNYLDLELPPDNPYL